MDMMYPTLFLIRGITGNGKTSLAKRIGGCVNIAADNYPGLYVDGEYQQHLQKESHEWVLQKVEEWMGSKLDIAVHNTFVRTFYLDQYLKLAKKYGYAVQIITSEAVILPNGERTKSTHNVPESVIDRMKEQWEPFNPPTRKGMTFKDLARQFHWVPQKYEISFPPDVIIFDKDGTITKPKDDNRIFQKTPDDFILNLDFFNLIDFLSINSVEFSAYVISNQKGVSTGQKTLDFLKQEVELMHQKIYNAFSGIYKSWHFTKSFFAISDREYLTYDPNERIWDNRASKFVVYKPGIELYCQIIENTENYQSKKFWIIGDAHTDGSSEDWQAASKVINHYEDVDIAYIPIEIAYQLAASALK